MVGLRDPSLRLRGLRRARHPGAETSAQHRCDVDGDFSRCDGPDGDRVRVASLEGHAVCLGTMDGWANCRWSIWWVWDSMRQIPLSLSQNSPNAVRRLN